MEEPSRFIKSLLDVIDTQERRIEDLSMSLDTERNKSIQTECRITDLETKVSNYNNDMRGVANALIKISTLDPLGQGNLYVDDAAIVSFVNQYKSKY